MVKFENYLLSDLNEKKMPNDVTIWTYDKNGKFAVMSSNFGWKLDEKNSRVYHEEDKAYIRAHFREAIEDQIPKILSNMRPIPQASKPTSIRLPIHVIQYIKFHHINLSSLITSMIEIFEYLKINIDAFQFENTNH